MKVRAFLGDSDVQINTYQDVLKKKGLCKIYIKVNRFSKDAQ